MDVGKESVDTAGNERRSDEIKQKQTETLVNRSSCFIDHACPLTSSSSMLNAMLLHAKADARAALGERTQTNESLFGMISMAWRSQFSRGGQLQHRIRA